MPHQNELGFKAFASLLKLLYDHFVWESNYLYKALGVDIEANWVLIFTLLEKHEQLSVTEIAKYLQFKHPTVNKMVNKMISKGYVAEEQDANDRRRRLLSLTAAGEVLLKEVAPIWQAAEEVGGELVQQAEIEVLEGLQRMVTLINKEPFHKRINAKLPSDLKIQN